jgi:hypothetical protein
MPPSNLAYPRGKAGDDFLRVLVEGQLDARLADVLVESAWRYLYHHQIIYAAFFAIALKVGIECDCGRIVAHTVISGIAQGLVEARAWI